MQTFAPTQNQMEIARSIDIEVHNLLKAGGDEALLQGLHPLMLQFKPILDTSKPGQMDTLCTEFEGFYHFAELLEAMAKAARDGVL